MSTDIIKATKSIRTIMVPVDDSQAAMGALNEACRLAKAFNASVTVVHIADFTRNSWGVAGFSDYSALDNAIADIRRQILQRASSTLEAAGVTSEIVVLESAGEKIADLIVCEAEKRHADYIVMGTHGFSGLLNLLLGSVAEGVVRQSSIPVLLIREQEK